MITFMSIHGRRSLCTNTGQSLCFIIESQHPFVTNNSHYIKTGGQVQHTVVIARSLTDNKNRVAALYFNYSMVYIGLTNQILKKYQRDYPIG